MVESALKHVRILEDLDFHLIKISLKASDIMRTVNAYKLMAKRVDYPFHVGITEAGTLVPGTVKSSAGLALLLGQGLADTIRVSLTAPPEEEVRVGFLILSSLGLRSLGPNLISCPTCGRCEVDLLDVVKKVEKDLSKLRSGISVALMGCMVNGPGEAREADIGLAFGPKGAVIFKKGDVFRRLKGKGIISEFLEEVKKFEKK
jgi:(E)-4-hydroxy-3-methylbut-2-enyl-diphosphate synthase